MPQHSVVVVRKRTYEEETSGESPERKREVKDDEEREKNDMKEDGQEDMKSQNSPSLTHMAINDQSSDIITDTVVEDYFPFLALPTELISQVFSFLSIKDRLILAGVNKILNVIEAESKYYVETLVIEERSIKEEQRMKEEWRRILAQPTKQELVEVDEKCEDDSEENEEEVEEDSEESEDDDEEDEEENKYEEKTAQRIIFYKDNKSYSSEFIRRISHNVTIGNLSLRLTYLNDFNREIYKLIKEFDIGYLELKPSCFYHYDLAREMLNDSFFLDLTRVCKSLKLYECAKITAEAMYTVYKNMIESLTKLRKFFVEYVPREIAFAFLKFIGITFKEGRFFSTRDIEIHAWNSDFVMKHSIFDGFLQIDFGSGILPFFQVRLCSIQIARNSRVTRECEE